MKNKIENYDLIIDYLISGKILLQDFKKAILLIRAGKFKDVTFTNYGKKVIINGKDK